MKKGNRKTTQKTRTDNEVYMIQERKKERKHLFFVIQEKGKKKEKLQFTKELKMIQNFKKNDKQRTGTKQVHNSTTPLLNTPYTIKPDKPNATRDSFDNSVKSRCLPLFMHR